MQGTTTSPPILKPRYRLDRVTSGLDTGEGEEVLGSSGRWGQGSVWGRPTEPTVQCPHKHPFLRAQSSDTVNS